MEQPIDELMTPFDKLISSPQLQMMKLLIPYTPPSSQRIMAVYIKFLELENTMSFFQNFHKDISLQEFDKNPTSPFDILEELRPYFPKEDKESFDSILNMMNMMEMYQTMFHEDEEEQYSEKEGEKKNGRMDEQPKTS